MGTADINGTTQGMPGIPGNKLPQYIAAISVSLGAISTGTVLAWTSNISEDLKKSKLNNISIDDESLGWIGSLAAIGAMGACIPIGIILDKLGRKLATILLTIPFTIGWLLIIFSNVVEMVYIGRFLTGIAGGAFCVAAPLYTSEICQTEIRGTLGSYFQLFITLGILLTYFLGFILEPLAYTIVLAIVPLVFCAIFFFQPETPFFYMMQNREVEARRALVHLRGPAYDVDTELKSIKEYWLRTEKNRMSLKDSLKTRNTRIASLVCFGLMFFQQWSGINAVIFYTTDIFVTSGSELDPKLATIIVGVMQVVATFVSSMLIDKLGRRILLIASDFCMAVAAILLGVFFSLQERQLADEETIKDLGFLPVLALSIFIMMFSIGYGPIPWMISSELFPEEIKSTAAALVGAFNWFMAFLITRFYLDLKNAFGGDSTFYLYSVISIAGTIFVFFVVPETKGKSLDDIQLELSGPKKTSQGVDNSGFSE